MPKVSVIMPAYNAEKYIAEAIDSILHQTFTDFEFIILDDGSSDRTVEIVTSYTDHRIRFYQNEHNMGVAATLNRGIELASGEYIARMDSDDIALRNRFQHQVKLLESNPELALCGANAVVFSENRESQTCLPTKNSDILFTLFLSSPFIHPVVMMRKSVLDTFHLRYEKHFEGREDHRLWMRFAALHLTMQNIKTPLLRYRVHEGQVTQKKDEAKRHKHKALKEQFLKELNLPYSEPELDALCKASLGDRLTKEELAPLYSLFTKIKDRFSEKKMPAVFQDVLLKALRDADADRSDYTRLTKGFSAKRKILGFISCLRN